LRAAALAREGGLAGLLICQLAVMPYGAKALAPGRVAVTSRKAKVGLGVFPARRGEEALARLRPAFPEFYASSDVVVNGLGRPAIGLHPVPMIMNAARIEQQTAPFLYDGYDITPSIARVIDAVDRERLAVMAALGAVDPPDFSGILEEFYGVRGADFLATVHAVPAYCQVKAPPDLRYRYLSEDVPTQTVPAAAVAAVLGVATPLLDGIIAFTDAMHGADYRATGWNLYRLGLAGLDAAGLRRFLADGGAA